MDVWVLAGMSGYWYTGVGGYVWVLIYGCWRVCVGISIQVLVGMCGY